MIIATWNVNSLNARMPRVIEWLHSVEPDVVCLQETKLADDAFESLTFSELGYESVHCGQGRWNGVAILSKVGLSDPVYSFDLDSDDPNEARFVGARCGDVLVHSVYVPNGRSLDNDHYQYKLRWLEGLKNYLENSCDPNAPAVVAGDWNVAPTDLDVWDPGFFEGMTHVSKLERRAIDAICEWGLVDTLRERYPEEPGLFSYYDYQAGRFHKRQGMRIDFILATQPLAGQSRLDVIDRNGRKGTKPSDHVPVIAVYN